jgi:hypothetical protein
MQFRLWESTFRQLYQNAVQAFPKTTRRQHSVDTIKIEEIRSTPYLGMRTLFIRCQADNSAGNGGVYTPSIMFKNVTYHNGPGLGVVEIAAADNGQSYYLSPLSDIHNHVLVRCGCKDFVWRFNFYDHVDQSLQGKVRKPYARLTDWAPAANPSESPGLCKHLMKLFSVLEQAGLVQK